MAPTANREAGRFADEDPNPVLRVAADGRLLYANRAGRQLVAGWQMCDDRVPPPWCDRIAGVLAAGEARSWDEACGEQVLQLHCVPITEAGYANIYGTDVTERAAALRESQARLQDIIRLAPTGIYEIDFRTTRFRTVNDAMCEILGYSREELTGMSAFDVLADPADRVLFAERVRRTLKGEKIDTSVEYRVKRKDGSVLYAILSTRIIFRDGKPDGAFVIAHDITERRQAADELARQGEQLRDFNNRLQALAARLADEERFLAHILESVPVQIAYLDAGLVYRQCNRSAATEMGWRVEDVLGRHLHEIVRDNPHVWEAVEGVLRTGQPFRSEELPVTWADRPEEGTQYYTVAYLPDVDASGQVRGMFVEGQRVTALVEARQQLAEARDRLEQRVAERTAELEASQAELRGLTRRLMDVQETERRNFARELHDEAAQTVTGLALQLAAVAARPDCPPAIAARLRELGLAVSNLMRELQELVSTLRPAVLDRGGLAPAISQYVNVLRGRHGLHIELVLEGLGETRLPPEIEIAVYRLVQEALTNVIRHADASHARVAVRWQDSAITAEVADDGAGFDIREAAQRGRLGLVGMRERAQMVGGHITFQSARGQGTRVTLEIPITGDVPAR